jgi:ribonucleoside-diphosphate reductase beta chain
MQYDISVNGRIITENSGIYPYLAYTVKLLNYSEQAKQTYLTLSGWETDTGGDVDITTSANKGWVKRKDRILNGKSDTVTGVLYADFAYALSQCPSNADICIILQKSRPEFFLQGGDPTATYRIKIEAIQLETRKYELSPSLNQKIEKQLASNGSVPFTHLSATNYFVPIGSTSFQIPRLVLGQIPLRIIFGVVTNSAFTGDIAKSPFNFKRHGVTQFQFSIDGKVHPSRPLEVTNFIEPYTNLFRNTGQYCSNTTCGITMDDFQKSFCIHVVNLRCDQSTRNDIYPHRQRGTVSLRMNFEAATSEGLTVVVISEFENIYLIDRLRNITSDHTIH